MEHLDIEIVKDWLQGYSEREKELLYFREQYERLQSSGDSPKAATITGLPKGPGPSLDRIGNFLQRKEELEAQLVERFEKAKETRAQIEAVLRYVKKADCRMVIRFRYIDRMGWDEITETLFITEPELLEKFDSYKRRVFGYHRKALEEMTEAIASGKNGVPSLVEIAA